MKLITVRYFRHFIDILLKLSPVLDITSALNELKFTKEIHVVAVNNEVKELLFLLEKDFNDEIQVKTANISKNKTDVFNFIWDQTETPNYSDPQKYHPTV